MRAKSGSAGLVRAACALVALAAVAWTFRDVEIERVRRLLSGVNGPVIALILLPQLGSLSVESLAWRSAFRSMSKRVGFLGLLRVRLQTEALAQTLPLGVVFSESIKPYLLGRCDVPLESAIAGVAARKYLLLASHSAYIVLCAVLGFDALARVSPAVIGVSGLPWLVLGAGFGVALTAVAFALTLGRGRVASRLLVWLERLPLAALKRSLAGSRRRFHGTDTELARFFALSPGRLCLPALGFFGGWLLESVETYLILRMLGVNLDFTTVAAFEVALSFVRNAVFVLPAGLGLQDFGYVVFLRALGVPDALNAGAAFSLLKRGKELCWASVGYALLGWDLRGRSRAHQLVWTA